MGLPHFYWSSASLLHGVVPTPVHSAMSVRQVFLAFIALLNGVIPTPVHSAMSVSQVLSGLHRPLKWRYPNPRPLCNVCESSSFWPSSPSYMALSQPPSTLQCLWVKFLHLPPNNHIRANPPDGVTKSTLFRHTCNFHRRLIRILSTFEISNWRGGVWCNSMQTVRSQHMATDCQEHDSAFMTIVVACWMISYTSVADSALFSDLIKHVVFVTQRYFRWNSI